MSRVLAGVVVCAVPAQATAAGLVAGEVRDRLAALTVFQAPGEAQPWLLAAGRRELYRVGWDEDRAELTPLPIPRSGAEWTHLSTGDVDGDGISELVLCGAAPDPWCELLSWQGERFERVTEPSRRHLRFYQDADGTRCLLGQASGSSKAFVGPIRRVQLAPTGRRRGPGQRIEDGEPLALPEGLPLYQFLWWPRAEEEEPYVFSFDDDGFATVSTAERPDEPRWRSEVPWATAPVRVQRSFEDLLVGTAWHWVPMPSEPLWLDGSLLVPRTQARPPNPAAEFRRLRGGTLEWVRRGENDLPEPGAVVSPLVGVALAAVAVYDLDGDGVEELVGAVWAGRSPAFRSRVERFEFEELTPLE